MKRNSDDSAKKVLTTSHHVSSGPPQKVSNKFRPNVFQFQNLKCTTLTVLANKVSLFSPN